MALKIFAPLILGLALAACGVSEESHSTTIQKQTGRFKIVEARDGYPPLVLDSAAGCVMALAKDETGTIGIDEVQFPDGSNSCSASKQLLVVDTSSMSK